ncbi:MAG: glutamate-1-semialdehyde 2,1-aminomutase [Phycisphaerales bacterium]|nr:MAG: glutamate-1-semialdehyde 2,1-aminomutase [Phycisphaerales bacterium]
MTVREVNEAGPRTVTKSESAFKAAQDVMPGGVNSPVRAFGAVGGTPRFIGKGSGAVVTDVDGNDYTDYVGSWGPMILGHAEERVVAAINKAAARGCSFGAPTEAETRLAELIIARVPSVEMVRLVNSGTEAAMSAVRLARAFTGRDAVVKFEGCYHGHADALLVQAGSGLLTFGTPSSPGVPAGTTGDTFVLPYNDPQAAERLFARHGERIAAVLVEPVAGNMGCVPPRDGFLGYLRGLCDKHEALLVFDEVMTGFRVAPGGAQELFGIEPDLTCMGKVLGGGLPMAAYGGRRDIMERVSPAGPVYQAGTLSGNPLATAAGIATLEALAEENVYETLEARSAKLAHGLADAARHAGVQVTHNRVGSMLCTFFTHRPVTDYASATTSDVRAYARFFHAMLDRGVYLAPSQFECMFVSTAHTDELIESTVAAAAGAFAEVARASTDPIGERMAT